MLVLRVHWIFTMTCIVTFNTTSSHDDILIYYGTVSCISYVQAVLKYREQCTETICDITSSVGRRTASHFENQSVVQQDQVFNNKI